MWGPEQPLQGLQAGLAWSWSQRWTQKFVLWKEEFNVSLLWAVSGCPLGLRHPPITPMFPDFNPYRTRGYTGAGRSRDNCLGHGLRWVSGQMSQLTFWNKSWSRLKIRTKWTSPQTLWVTVKPQSFKPTQMEMRPKKQNLRLGAANYGNLNTFLQFMNYFIPTDAQTYCTRRINIVICVPVNWT